MSDINKFQAMNKVPDSKDSEYELFQNLLKDSVDVLGNGINYILSDEIGDERLKKIYLDYLKTMCMPLGESYLDDDLLSEESLQNAIENYNSQTVNINESVSGFFLLLPVKVNPANDSEPPHLTICKLDESGEAIVAGESKHTDLMKVVPNEFKHHAYGLFVSDESLAFNANMKVQLNYYRALFDLDPII